VLFPKRARNRNYFLVVFAGAAAFAGFIALAAMLLAGLIAFAMLLAAFAIVLAATCAVLAAVFTAFITVVLAAGLTGVLFAGASPQAIPSAPKPRTVESKITFFILFFKLLSLSQRLKYL
jgi:uncharacterized membrane protein